MIRTTWLLLLSLSLATPALALETERVSDRELKDAVKSLQKSASRFDKKLDREIRNAVVRSPSGEMDMKRFLEDFADNIGKIDDRYRGSYAASAEALTVLRQGNDLKDFMVRHPGIDGAAEWQLLEADLARLANTYTSPWPIDPASPQVRRIGDKEFSGALETMDRGIAEVSRSVKKQAKNLPEEQQDVAAELLREAELAEELLGPVRTKLKRGDPALAEARILLDKAAAIETRLGQIQVDERTRQAWSGTRNAVGKFAQGCGLVWPPVD